MLVEEGDAFTVGAVTWILYTLCALVSGLLAAVTGYCRKPRALCLTVRSVGAAGECLRIRTMCYGRDCVEENLLFSCGASSLCFPSLVETL
jgi:hypothetical protein